MLSLIAMFALATIPEPIGLTHHQLNTACIAGVNGNEAQSAVCIRSIRESAAELEVADAATVSSCMAVPRVSNDELVWTYLDWSRGSSYAGDAQARTAVLAAILTAYPCGWTTR